MNILTTLLNDNWHAFKDINGMAGHQPLLDPLMVLSANDLIFLLPLILLCLWFALARWSPLATNVNSNITPFFEYERGLGQRMALLGCGAVAIALAFNITLGHLFFEPRPFVAHPHTVHLLVAHAADASFPSDHEAVAGAVASTLLLYFLLIALYKVRQLHQNTHATLRALGLSRMVLFVGILTLLALGAMATIGVARVYIGVHYPGDILGGVACGFLAALLITALRRVLEPILAFIIQVAERLHLA